MLARKKLALRLFGVLAGVNLLLWLVFSPTPAPAPQPASGVELRISATLLTPFAAGKRVLWATPDGRPLGVVRLERQESEGLVVSLGPELYRRHQRTLVQGDGVLLPYLPGMGVQRPALPGRTYEIAY